MHARSMPEKDHLRERRSLRTTRRASYPPLKLARKADTSIQERVHALTVLASCVRSRLLRYESDLQSTRPCRRHHCNPRISHLTKSRALSWIISPGMSCPVYTRVTCRNDTGMMQCCISSASIYFAGSSSCLADSFFPTRKITSSFPQHLVLLWQAFSPSFFFATEGGAVCYADDLGHCSEVQQLTSEVDRLVFYEAARRLVIITRSLLMTQLQVGTYKQRRNLRPSTHTCSNRD